MSKPLKPRRGTTAEQNAFVGEAYEITYDTDKNTIVCRDGLTAGGFPLAKEGDLNAFKGSQSTRDSQQDAAISAAQTAANNALVSAVIEDGELVLTYGNGTVKRESLPGGLPLGTLFPYTGKDVPAGTLRADGATYTNMRASFPEFYEWVVASGLTVPLADYALVEGSCGYYGLDTSTGTVRMPTLAAGVFGADAASKYGQAVQAGLPNVTGSLRPYNWTRGEETGAFGRGADIATAVGTSGSYANAYLTFDASKSNPIYGKSNTVTPSHVKYPWVIVVYNAAVPPSVAQANQFVGLLDGKADVNLGNVTAEGKAAVVGWGMPDYSAGFSISSGHKATANGVVVAKYWYNNAVFRILANGVPITGGGSEGIVLEVNYINTSALVKKGDVITLWTAGTITVNMTFYPMVV